MPAGDGQAENRFGNRDYRRGDDTIARRIGAGQRGPGMGVATAECNSGARRTAGNRPGPPMSRLWGVIADLSKGGGIKKTPAGLQTLRQCKRLYRCSPTRSVVSEEPDVETIGSLLADATVRTILARTSQEPMSANTLCDHCESSKATVYRRLDELSNHGLLSERTLPDTDGGHHRTVYQPTLDRVTITVRDGDIELQVREREDMADRFTRLIEEM